MGQRGGGSSLARDNARLLAIVFFVFELLAAAAVIGFLMAPMARRSADDLAGLMILSAQTWSELPPHTRPDFEDELARTHLLSMRPALPASSAGEWHGVYLHFLEQSLATKTGRPQHLAHELIDGKHWFWAWLPSGERAIAVGFPGERVGTQPVRTFVATLIVGIGLAIFAAIGLARRITRPLARLEAAVSEVGRGDVPEPLPETGPRELATLSRRINEMARQVRELLAARTTLLAGVSHDLRTPLARMRLALALLEEQPHPDHIRRLERDIEAMDQLIGRVLDLARGLEQEPASPIDLGQLLTDCARAIGHDQVHVSLAPSVGHWQLAPLALRRVIDNLLENALRYGGAAPIDLVAETTASELHIGVLDRGPGIPDDQLEAVFQPFHRVEGSRSRITGGSGLGLAIVRQLANANGWTVELSRRPGGGLEAWVRVKRPHGQAGPVTS